MLMRLTAGTEEMAGEVLVPEENGEALSYCQHSLMDPWNPDGPGCQHLQIIVVMHSAPVGGFEFGKKT